MEMDICVIALAQLNRGLEQRASRKPALGDLRESGSLENDADTVLFMNPEPEEDGIKRGGQIDIVIAKQRSGPHGIDVPLVFEGKYARFRLQWTPHAALRGAA
jgi:replicative DNA helicase